MYDHYDEQMKMSIFDTEQALGIIILIIENTKLNAPYYIQ